MKIEFVEAVWTVSSFPVASVGARGPHDPYPQPSGQVAIVLSNDKGERRVSYMSHLAAAALGDLGKLPLEQFVTLHKQSRLVDEADAL
jgi:hypothetical protein